MADNSYIIPDSLTRAVAKLRTATNPNQVTPAMEGGILTDILAVLRRFEQVMLSIGDDGTIVIPPSSGDGDNATHPYLTSAPDGKIVASALNSFAMWLLSVTSDVVNVKANGQGTYDGFITTISADNTSHGIVIRKGSEAAENAAAIYTDATGVCPGLNADMLDGKHLSEILAQVGSGGSGSGSTSHKIVMGFGQQSFDLIIDDTVHKVYGFPVYKDSNSGWHIGEVGSVLGGDITADSFAQRTRPGVHAPSSVAIRRDLEEGVNGAIEIDINKLDDQVDWGEYEPDTFPPVWTNSEALCPCLNADLLDGFHADGLFQSMLVSGTTLSVKIGNKTRSVTLPSSSSSSSDLSEFLNYTYAPLNPSSKRGVGIFYNGELMLEFMSNACLPPSDNKMRMGQQDTRFSTFWVEHLYANNTSSTSDMRLKDPVADLKLSINQIADAPSFSFKWKESEDERAFIGSSAQYWRDILPEAVCGEDEESPYLGLDYSKVAMAIGIANARAIRELCRRSGNDDIIDSLF